MKSKSSTPTMKWRSEDRARHEAIRKRFLKQGPSQAELLKGGEYFGPIPIGAYLEIRTLLTKLKKARQAARLTLSEVSRRCGIDPATLSRLESGRQDNPTVETLYRYAAAIGKRIGWVLKDAISETK